MPPETDGALFARLRPRLVRIAYRMVGSVAEAEDVVQEAWLRWQAADRAAVRSPEHYLARVVGRLSLDHLKSARVRRERYVGAWLPEPLIESLASDAPEAPDRDEVTLTLMVALERLSPLERAAFLLHDVFDMSFAEVALAIGREPSTCRQLAARARGHVREARPRFPLAPGGGDDLVAAFFEASTRGDLERLRGLLAEEVVAYADGGGIRPATFNPILGRAKVIRLYAGLAGKRGNGAWTLLARVTIDGLPGAVLRDPDGGLQTTALLCKAGRIEAIFAVRNPEKLRHVEAVLRELETRTESSIQASFQA